MPSVNDDMDELFRRAADEYPLNTDAANWNKIKEELNVQPIDEAPEKKNRKYLWWLLLLPIGFICGGYFVLYVQQKNIESFPEQLPPIPVNNTNGNQLNIQRQNKPASPTRSSNPVAIQTARLPDKDLLSKPAKAYVRNEVAVAPIKKAKMGNLKTRHENPLLQEWKKQSGMANQSLKTHEAKEVIIPDNALQDFSVKKEDAPIQSAVPPTSYSLPATVDGSGTTAKEQNDQSQQSLEKTKDSQNGSLQKSGVVSHTKWLVSLMAGPDFSLVKGEKTTGVGISVGMKWGYYINKRLLAETGILYDRKKYRAKGEYLDTSRLKLPPHSVVNHLDGSCNMLEIPLNIAYTIRERRKYSWYVTMGVSSYIMLKEDYNIDYTRYNQPYSKAYYYTHSSTNWVSILNIGAGYRRKMGKISLEMAPYIKIPMSGVGIGKLPISSAGVYVVVNKGFR